MDIIMMLVRQCPRVRRYKPQPNSMLLYRCCGANLRVWDVGDEDADMSTLRRLTLYYPKLLLLLKTKIKKAFVEKRHS